MSTRKKILSLKTSSILKLGILYGIIVISNLGITYGSSETQNQEMSSLAKDEAPLISENKSEEDSVEGEFSNWSEWSTCDRVTCSQKRFRNCRTHSETALCKKAVIEEKRFCSKPHRCKRNHRKSFNTNTSRIVKNMPFQVVKRTMKKTLKSLTKTSETKTRKQRTRRKLYSRWSHWTMCSKSCTTQRFRWCKRTAVCGNDVMSESALCYVEGSYCERWIHKRLGESSSQEELMNSAAKINTDLDVTNYSSRPKDPPSRRPMRAPREEANHDCGYTFNHSSSSSSYPLERWNMLRIIGGRPSRKGKWPWQVALLNRFKEAFCGGTLISSMWVVTAAHCIRKKLYIRLGEYDLASKEGSELEFKVERAIKHTAYDSDTVDNDIALLKLPASSGAPSGRLPTPVCLPRDYQALPPTTSLCTIIGWGKRKSTDHYGTDVLHEAQVCVRLVPHTFLHSQQQKILISLSIMKADTYNMFCAGYRGGRMDSCSGDSGGPLLCRDSAKSLQWTIHGITSFGEGCGRKGKFGIYTRMSNYVKWAQSVMHEYS
ncbi:hypothetical protein LSTR_LSTR006010 [Laodelphax striatellus]|uniref:Peptidase S1 domain-containing protein n=1 Tax=Laodelphax striatellus TaxID=195883 RepID=A0A482XPQ6_LAOST|nr:hypothetical protein LSTR_LSTR006010 [Laodelphax striatellus]